jgi:hypothetical protein
MLIGPFSTALEAATYAIQTYGTTTWIIHYMVGVDGARERALMMRQQERY